MPIESYLVSVPTSPASSPTVSTPASSYSASVDDYEVENTISLQSGKASAVGPAERSTGSEAESSAATLTTENVSVVNTPQRDDEQHAEELITLNGQQHQLTSIAREESQARFMVDESSPYVGPGPAVEFPINHVYRCFDVENGLLFRLVNNKRHIWAFYNDTSEYMMRISVTFGPESSIKALGSARQVSFDKETGQCQLMLDVAPGETQNFMRGEYNGFYTCYDASPINVATDVDA
ncbi:conserved hypothetical protein [Leishmania major strain Friedlin]|uniref:DUF1935 domain-containing protein n=1 Tax=Leishmania major TaxID=5664 RepID=Q4QCS1_LEIMA|nr:conserved hypothetical protein [Leishmania major strain Friedlin]CAG9573198.1 Domain_of_unknown_function_(DUF1935)_-_putative [Leishmania major strain Friedlin]CAJ04229.1 conserved hypothetical protein [Leishmania major strain Friedlin]|eukprot:XP_001682877.1 conserved hypothetical protein [Leishmania major strain Friedlin]